MARSDKDSGDGASAGDRARGRTGATGAVGVTVATGVPASEHRWAATVRAEGGPEAVAAALRVRYARLYSASG